MLILFSAEHGVNVLDAAQHSLIVTDVIKRRKQDKNKRNKLTTGFKRFYNIEEKIV
jgi:hypothetical protein